MAGCSYFLAHLPCETAATPQGRSLPLLYQLIQQKYAVSKPSSNTRRLVFLLPQTPNLNGMLPFALEGYKVLYSKFFTGFSSACLVPYTETTKPSSTTLPDYTTPNTPSAFVAYPGSPLFTLAPALFLSPWSLWGLDWMTFTFTGLNPIRPYL